MADMVVGLFNKSATEPARELLTTCEAVREVVSTEFRKQLFGEIHALPPWPLTFADCATQK